MLFAGVWVLRGRSGNLQTHLHYDLVGCSLVHLFICSLVNFFISSFLHFFIYSFIHLFTCSFVHFFQFKLMHFYDIAVHCLEHEFVPNDDDHHYFTYYKHHSSHSLGPELLSWLPNQMISLVLLFGFLCRSSISIPRWLEKYSTAMC